ncbi:hypothetical protein GCM10009674_11240 [Nesterenkonia xinjiangensis]
MLTGAVLLDRGMLKEGTQGLLVPRETLMILLICDRAPNATAVWEPTIPCVQRFM